MRINKYFGSQRGVTPTGAIIFIIVAAILVLVLIQVGKPFMFSATYKNELKSITQNCINKNDNQFLRQVKAGAKDRGFTLKDSDIQFSRGYDNESLKLSIKYSYLLKLPYYEKLLVFDFTTEQFLYDKEGEEEGESENGNSGVKQKQKKTKGFFNRIKEIFGI